MVIGIFGMFYSMLFLRAKLYKILILALPSIIPILFWLEIPGSRFFSTSFWWFGTAFIVFPLTQIIKKGYLNYFCFLVIFFSISIHTFDRLGSPKKIFPLYLKPKIPKVTTKKLTNDEGFVYFSPKEGDLCWDSPIPCSPEPEFWMNGVVQINKNKIWEGFRIQK